ncbi:acyl-CoA dehydrogenase [Candidatus Chloroploca sp. Khr17]|uniref:acyl-CoA dehydrogenase n=1 Tax=Candidatus Chloroploca sp. Khr17 TaxID=2496869 RepID=UPI00101E2007|nr:acyl-CoA dehydrogenase [Candidatus Chloroploca sp. Khr17]
MSDAEATFSSWIGTTELLEDDLSPAQAYAAAATLDDTTTMINGNATLPPLWHWFYFVPRAPQSKLSSDGHPERGGFLPPIPYPRRMFAGARLTFYRPLLLGRTAQRKGEIRNIVQKSGRSGNLAFVTVGYQFYQQGILCLEEEQDIVYREPGPPVPAPVPAELPPVPEGAWTRTVTPDPRLLFRFSALTFNAHRIHYDRPYATNEEGYPGLVVHGPLTAVLLLELVRHSTNRRITGFSFRGQAPLFDLAPFRLVATPEEERVMLEAQGPDGRVALSAVAELG